MPGQRRDVTYVSRLQCVQAAIDQQLEVLAKEHPKAKVGLGKDKSALNLDSGRKSCAKSAEVFLQSIAY